MVSGRLITAEVTSVKPFKMNLSNSTSDLLQSERDVVTILTGGRESLLGRVMSKVR